MKISRKHKKISTQQDDKRWPDLSFFSRPRRSCRALSLSARSADLLSRGFADLSSLPRRSRPSPSLIGLCRILWRSHSRTGGTAGLAFASFEERDFAASCPASTRSRPPMDLSRAPRPSTCCDSVGALPAVPPGPPTALPFLRNSNYDRTRSGRLQTGMHPAVMLHFWRVKFTGGVAKLIRWGGWNL